MNALALPLCVMASGAFAQTMSIDGAPVQQKFVKSCSIVTECFDTEACADTTYDFQLEGRAGGVTAADMLVSAVLSDSSETIDMIGGLSDAGVILSDTGMSARRILTIDAAGQARFTVHFIDGPVSITYAGTCE